MFVLFEGLTFVGICFMQVPCHFCVRPHGRLRRRLPPPLEASQKAPWKAARNDEMRCERLRGCARAVQSKFKESDIAFINIAGD